MEFTSALRLSPGRAISIPFVLIRTMYFTGSMIFINAVIFIIITIDNDCLSIVTTI